MKRSFRSVRLFGMLLFAFVGVAVTDPVEAGSFPLTGTTTPSYTNPIDGTLTKGGSDWVTFGNYQGSVLAADGVNYSANTCQPFAAGSIGYYNGGSANIPSQVTYQIQTDYTTANGAKGSSTFDFGLSLSPNGNSKDSVTVSVNSQYSTGAAVSKDGSTVYMEFLGFSYSNSCNQNLSQTITVDKGTSQTEYLWVQYRVVEPESQTPAACDCNSCPNAPEPSTWCMGIIGGLLIGFRKYSRGWKKRGKAVLPALA